jgi:hypothetical protein
MGSKVALKEGGEYPFPTWYLNDMSERSNSSLPWLIPLIKVGALVERVEARLKIAADR